MLLRVFRGTGPGVILLIAVTLILLWLKAFTGPFQPAQETINTDLVPLYGFLIHILGSNHLAGTLFSFALVAVMAFLVVGFNTSVFFINERTFLPALFYILLTSVFYENQILNPALPAAIFLMLALMRLMEAYRKPGIAYNFFDAGILISTGTLFYSDLIWFAVLIFIGMIILRTINLLEIFIALAGLVTPFLVTSGIYFVMDKDPALFLSELFAGLFDKTGIFIFQRVTIVMLVITALIILISIFHLLYGINNKKIKSRKTFYLLLWILVLSVVMYLAVPSISIEIAWIMAIPASYLLTHYFVFTGKSLVSGIIFTGYFVLILLLEVYRFV